MVSKLKRLSFDNLAHFEQVPSSIAIKELRSEPWSTLRLNFLLPDFIRDWIYIDYGSIQFRKS